MVFGRTYSQQRQDQYHRFGTRTRGYSPPALLITSRGLHSAAMIRAVWNLCIDSHQTWHEVLCVFPCGQVIALKMVL